MNPEIAVDLQNEIKCPFDDNNASSSLYPKIINHINCVLNDVQKVRGIAIPDNVHQTKQLNYLFNKLIGRIKQMNIKGHELIKSLIILHHIHEKYRNNNVFHGNNVTDILYYFVTGLMLV
jgi:hypothetical protein